MASSSCKLVLVPFFFLPDCCCCSCAALLLLLAALLLACCCCGTGEEVPLSLLLLLPLLGPARVGQLSPPDCTAGGGDAAAAAGGVGGRAATAADARSFAAIGTAPLLLLLPPPLLGGTAACCHCDGRCAAAALLLLLLPAAARCAADLPAAAPAAPALGFGAEHTSQLLLLGALLSVQRSQVQEPFVSTSCNAARAASGGTQPLPPAAAAFMLSWLSSRYCLCAAMSAPRLSASGQSAASCGTSEVSPSSTQCEWYLPARHTRHAKLSLQQLWCEGPIVLACQVLWRVMCNAFRKVARECCGCEGEARRIANADTLFQCNHLASQPPSALRGSTHTRETLITTEQPPCRLCNNIPHLLLRRPA